MKERRHGRETPRRVVIVKLGGSLITDKTQPSTARPEVIARLAKEIAEALPELEGHLLLGHGSGSFGHVAASRCGLGKGVFSPPRQPADAIQRRGLAETQHQAASLHRLVTGAMLDAGLSPPRMGRVQRLDGLPRQATESLRTLLVAFPRNGIVAGDLRRRGSMTMPGGRPSARRNS